MDIVMPQLGETVKEGTVAAWHKKVGERVEKDEPLFEVETEKVDTEVPAPAAGVLAAILVPAGDTVKVGTRLAVIEVAGEARAAPGGAASAGGTSPRPGAGAARAAAPGHPEGERKLSPVVRRLLAEHHLDPAVLVGTGAEGRITRDDVLAHVERTRGGPAPAPARADSEHVAIPMSAIRRRTAAHMARSVATSPHVLQAVEVDFHAVEEARRARGEAWKARERFSLTYLPFVARAVCEAIREFPHVNASVEGESLVVHRAVHLGVAVDLSFEGLVVPVIRDAERESVRSLAVRLHEAAEKARHGALRPDDVTGGTYTLSNSGTFGTLLTAPIIHQPQVAILSIDGVRKRPVVVEGPGGDAIVARPVGVLAQCFDHRAFDGAYSAAFLRRVKDVLEGRDWSAELA
jgi:pyruvate dehydrogenase E2 component (dihydrolipoyllysine-residue acetyltransferase)